MEGKWNHNLDSAEADAEKKVEYIELIYDLIFVYLVGRNNALLHTIEGGFFTGSTFLTYIISTLVILQIWFFSNLFINRYGSNSVADTIGLFINMYLLYYMADGIRTNWDGHFVSYHVAWGLILLNLSAQYFLRLRRSRGMMPWEDRHLRYHMLLLLAQALIVFAAIPLYWKTGLSLSWLSLLFGIVAAAVTVRIDALVPVNFEHLTERVMLYVVFTFGETIVGIANYFEGGFSLNTLYFSLTCFLIVAGLFLSYGFLYNHVIDRERVTTGTMYMMIHIFLIIALNNMTVALEFMPEDEISVLPKNVFLISSFLAYYLFMFFIGFYAKSGCRAGWRFTALLLGLCAVFTVLMAVFYRSGRTTIAVSLVFVYAVLFLIWQHWRISQRGA